MCNVPKIIEFVVNNDICIGCGLCTYKYPNNALKMEWNVHGFMILTIIGSCHTDCSCLAVCPFNPYPEKVIQTENELSDILFKG